MSLIVLSGKIKAHEVVMSGLDEYWSYNISIRAFTEDSDELYTADSQVKSGLTNESS